MDSIIRKAKTLYDLEKCEFYEVPEHDGGRNRVYICVSDGVKKYVLRISDSGDRTAESCLAETEFVHYLAANGAPVADAVPSVNGRLVEEMIHDGGICFMSLFGYAKGMLLCDNGYRYREGVPIEEYFFNTGKTLGVLHRLSKKYQPMHRRSDYFDKYDMGYIGRLIPDDMAELKGAISGRLEEFRALPKDDDTYGLVHFDYSDGNYHIDMETGDITVFDFDNCMYCWYMFDLANLWTHGEGWCRGLPDEQARAEYMKHYFDTIVQGYRTETDISDDMLARLPLFIDMVLIENIVDEFECCAREGEEVDPEDIEDAAAVLMNR